MNAYRSYIILIRHSVLPLAILMWLQSCKQSENSEGSASENKTDSSNTESTETSASATTSEKILIPGEDDQNENPLVVEEGAAVASDVAGAYLDLPPGIVPAGPSVSIRSNGIISAGQLAIDVTIPLDQGDGMSLTTSEPENLVVMYQIETTDGKTVFGIIPRSELKVDIDQVTFTWLGDGNYQAASLPVLVETPKKSESIAVPVLTSAKEAELPTVTWSLPVGTFTANPRQVNIAATVQPSDLGLVSCVAVLDEDKASPYDLSASAGSTPQHLFTIVKQSAHTLYGRLQCIDIHGRVNTSQWSAAIAVAAIPPPIWTSQVGSIDALAGQPLSVTLNATGASSYSLNTNSMDCDSAGGWAPTLTIDSATGVISGTPNTIGATCNVSATATNVGGTITQAFIVTIWRDPGNICDSITGSVCTVTATKNLSSLSLIKVDGDLTIAPSGIIDSSSSDTSFIKVGGTLRVQNGGQIKGTQIKIDAANATIDFGGIISANAVSTYTGAIPGSIYSAPNTGLGAPHGGNGGQDAIANPSASAYGNAAQPSTIGAAGANGSVGFGGKGGGAIKIAATSTLTVNGIISADGEDGGNSFTAGGGGSGGSIWLVTNILAGNGSLTANGGKGGDDSISQNGAGGAGGRIARYYTTNTFSGSIDVNGGGSGLGAGSPAGIGGNGTSIAGTTSPREEIFTSSTSYNGNFGNLQGADANCQDLAVKAALSGRWKALLSGSGVSAKERLAFTGPLHNRAGTLIASSSTGLWSGALAAAVDKDEFGNVASVLPWTGTLATGMINTTTCSNWTSSSAADTSTVGDYASTTGLWLNNLTRTCNQLQALYCVSQ